jgi:hypothetical protein
MEVDITKFKVFSMTCEGKEDTLIDTFVLLGM